MLKINGGFFWMQDGGAVVVPNIDGMITNSIFFSRPKWYQIAKWYRALKYWVNLPH